MGSRPPIVGPLRHGRTSERRSPLDVRASPQATVPSGAAVRGAALPLSRKPLMPANGSTPSEARTAANVHGRRRAGCALDGFMGQRKAVPSPVATHAVPRSFAARGGGDGSRKGCCLTRSKARRGTATARGPLICRVAVRSRTMGLRPLIRRSNWRGPPFGRRSPLDVRASPQATVPSGAAVRGAALPLSRKPLMPANGSTPSEARTAANVHGRRRAGCALDGFMGQRKAVPSPVATHAVQGASLPEAGGRMA